MFLAKKHSGYIIAGLLLAMGIAGPLFLKAIAVIAGKALIISKVALTVAGIIALKKIFSSQHEGKSFSDTDFYSSQFFDAFKMNSDIDGNKPSNSPYRYYANQ